MKSQNHKRRYSLGGCPPRASLAEECSTGQFRARRWTALRLLRIYFKRAIEAAASHSYTQCRVQNKQGVVDRIHHGLGQKFGVSSKPGQVIHAFNQKTLSCQRNGSGKLYRLARRFGFSRRVGGTLPVMASPRSTRDPLFLGRWFQDEVIIVAVRWYLIYPLSYRQVCEMLRDCGVSVRPVPPCLSMVKRR